MDLRKYAKGKPCQIRIPGVCNGDLDTTSLAHIRRGNVAGVGQKPPDLIGIVACSSCHDVIDRRNKMGSYTKQDIDGYLLDALCRQLALYLEEGVVSY